MLCSNLFTAAGVGYRATRQQAYLAMFLVTCRRPLRTAEARFSKRLPITCEKCNIESNPSLFQCWRSRRLWAQVGKNIYWTGDDLIIFLVLLTWKPLTSAKPIHQGSTCLTPDSHICPGTSCSLLSACSGPMCACINWLLAHPNPFAAMHILSVLLKSWIHGHNDLIICPFAGLFDWIGFIWCMPSGFVKISVVQNLHRPVCVGLS